MIFFDGPLHISRWILNTIDTQITISYKQRMPSNGTVLVVSNHRSILDAPLLMTALNRSVRFACHHYMSQVPVLREIVTALGAFPIDSRQQRQKSFFQQAVSLLEAKEIVGIFPEGAHSMVRVRKPHSVAPLKLFSWFDSSEPLFDSPDWHPAVVYQRAHILVGRPFWITETQRQQYRGRGGVSLARDLSKYCYNEIAGLLHEGCYSI
jgi:1-acyl-sn-glycerol-3-phosphate acyltransferase